MCVCLFVRAVYAKLHNLVDSLIYKLALLCLCKILASQLSLKLGTKDRRVHIFKMRKCYKCCSF